MSRVSGRFVFPFLFAALLWVAPEARAQEGLGDDDGPVFLIVSLNDEPLTQGDGTFAFDTTVTMVNIGTFVGGGPAVGDARFIVAATLPTVPRPGDVDLEDLDGNEATVLGSFQTSATTDPAHIVIPAPPGEGGIPADIQAAVFAAMRDTGFAALASDGKGGPAFPTTGDIAEFIQDFLPEGSEHSATTIASFIFETDITVVASTASCEGEGSLFPYLPGDALATAGFAFDADGEFTALDICLLVEIEVKPSSVNLKKEGSISVAIYASDTFDTDDIDETTVEIGGVFADDVTFAAKKATAHFSVQDLVDAGVLTSSSTEVTLRAELSDGSCITGTSAISIK